MLTLIEGLVAEFVEEILRAVVAARLEDLDQEAEVVKRPRPRPKKRTAKRVTVEDRARKQNAVSLAAVLEHVPAAPKARRIDKLVSLTGIKPVVLRELLRKPIESGEIVEMIVTGKKAYMKSAAAKVAA